MIEIHDGCGHVRGTKDWKSDHLHCPEENCREFGHYWCSGGSVYYCGKCEAYRFYDKRFNGYFPMEKGDLVEAYINRHGYFFAGRFSGSIVEINHGYLILENGHHVERIGFFEITGVSYPGVGENRFYSPKIYT